MNVKKLENVCTEFVDEILEEVCQCDTTDFLAALGYAEARIREMREQATDDFHKMIDEEAREDEIVTCDIGVHFHDGEYLNDLTN